MNFIKYILIGILNTAIHWSVFYICTFSYFSQSNSNLIAFIVASTLSYILNSKYNFNKPVNVGRYCIFLIGMGCLNFVIGQVGDIYNFIPIITLIITSLLSLFFGFLFSKFFIFRVN
ncbi:GtrA family protein [Acinetobacter sp. HY1485]|uniref:GtrA family protein n=1 Tax=Acinetobacter sp. HY1485 TaxID=2970918 RepID=UPI003FA4254E